MIISNKFNNMISSPVRTNKARVELYNGSTLLNIFKHDDDLQDFTIDKIGNNAKFFGYGICQKANIKLLDPRREKDITTANTFEVEFGVDADYLYFVPTFKVTEVNRAENTNELSITAYDALYFTQEHTVSELELPDSYDIRDFLIVCANFIGLPYKIDPAAENAFKTLYYSGANFDGAETIRAALDAIAEATQTIYFINSIGEIYFKRLDVNGRAVLTIRKDDYFKLDSKTNRRLTGLCSATELGDNVSVTTGESGTTQYMRDNPFLELREDITTLLDNALAAVGGLTINQFEVDWRGNYLLECGDKIDLITKDNKTVTAYYLNDTLEYDGGLSSATGWNYTDNDGETASNPAKLGDVLKQTYARVDKQNKQIEIVASESAANNEAISKIAIATDTINASVSKVSQALDDELTKLNDKVEAKISANDVTIAIQQEIAKGIDKVTTATGFTFDENGLTITKTDSDISTRITDNGMTVTKGDNDVLIADNKGVAATDLHAKTYLIIGSNSRLEDYNGRTGCFWLS